jgi:hypothetical protein
MKAVSLKDRIKEKLEEKGTLTPEDLAEVQGAEVPLPKPPGAEAEEDTKAQVSDKVLDPLMKGARETSTDESVSRAALMLGDVPDDPMGLDSALDEVEITADDKKRFMDCFVDGVRFTRPFSMMGGKMAGVFRCRTSGESRAIIEELARQGELHDETVYEHAVKMRYALLHCQLAELNHVSRLEWKEPLMSVQKIDTGSRKVTAEPPAWYPEMQLLFDGKMDGTVNALYGELKKFEKVYWTLVRNVANQDFWLPEDSITE